MKVIIDKKNMSVLDGLRLHDMELMAIKIDYCGHKALIPVLDMQKKEHYMIFEDVQYCAVDIFEPWGSGRYINKVKTATSNLQDLIDLKKGNSISEDAFLTDILLNSGDSIIILAEKISYE